MEHISKSIKKKDHGSKTSGRALYVDDYYLDGMLHGKLLRSTKPKARIKDIILPQLPDGYITVDYKDVTGINQVHIVQDDTPVFVKDTVEFVGDPILMVVGPDSNEVIRLLNEIVIEYEELPPILDMMESKEVFFHQKYEKGEVDKAFKEADVIIEETFETGYQEQAYLETNGLLAYPEDEKIVVRGSMQCPYYVHGAIATALGCDNKKVRVIQDETGGAFGGKEDFPSILGCQAAVAAKKANKPVKIVFDREEDIEFTSKRHPSLSTYKVAIKHNKITGMDIDVTYNSGAYTTLSLVVLQRGVIGACGVYNIENLRVEGRAVKTNTVPCGAFRGFGAPQTFFSIEMMMDHVAKKLDIDSLGFKEKHIAKQGNPTSTSGMYHYHVPLPEMIERIKDLSDYRNKRSKYKNQTGRYRKGIGLSLFYHGCGFTGSGERDLIKAVAKIKKHTDDKVEILTSITDMGQGAKTTFCKIVADTLQIPISEVFFNNPDTDFVPDSGPTVASRSVMTVGALIQKAAKRLKDGWEAGKEQVLVEKYVEPDYKIPFDKEKFTGDAYPDYSWGVNVIEVEVDTLTAVTKVLGAWGVYDVGVPIDLNIVHGQMQGGILQSIGYASIEKMKANDWGVIRNNSLSDYLIPTSLDATNIVTDFVNNPYNYGPYGAKGAGELPAVGPAPAYTEAVECALESSINKIPVTQEETMKVIKGAKL